MSKPYSSLDTGRSLGGTVEAGEVIDPAEQFMPLEQMENLILAALVHNGRIDDEGRVMPLEMVHMDIGANGGFAMETVMEAGPLLPPRDDVTQVYNDGSSTVSGVDFDIYSALTSRSTVDLSYSDTEQLRNEAKVLGRTVDAHGLSGKLVKWQMFNSYQISKPQTYENPALAGEVRLYIPGGLEAMSIVRQAIDAGADFYGAKILLPDMQLGRREFRSDTPIFRFSTRGEMSSTITVLRGLYEDGSVDLNQADTPPLGLPVEGLPGAYIGQMPKGRSFNGAMSDFFTEPVREACNASGLQAGDYISGEWISWIAYEARAIALDRAESAGVNPACHALLRDQDPDVIFDAVNY